MGALCCVASELVHVCGQQQDKLVFDLGAPVSVSDSVWRLARRGCIQRAGQWNGAGCVSSTGPCDYNAMLTSASVREQASTMRTSGLTM